MAKLELPESRIIYLSRDVDQSSVQNISKSILEYNLEDEKLSREWQLEGQTYSRKPIQLYIDSYGGSVYAGLGLIGVMESSKTPIHTYVTGCAMSCGLLISLAGHKRFAHKHSTFMYHQVSDVLFGNVQHIKEDLRETERLQDVIEDLVLRKTKIKKEKIKEIREKKQDWYITAKKALSLGIIEEII